MTYLGAVLIRFRSKVRCAVECHPTEDGGPRRRTVGPSHPAAGTRCPDRSSDPRSHDRRTAPARRAWRSTTSQSRRSQTSSTSGLPTSSSRPRSRSGSARESTVSSRTAPPPPSTASAISRQIRTSSRSPSGDAVRRSDVRIYVDHLEGIPWVALSGLLVTRPFTHRRRSPPGRRG